MLSKTTRPTSTELLVVAYLPTFCYHGLTHYGLETSYGDKSGSILAQAMACCLTAPSHYLTQCWLIISNVLWHSSEGIISEDVNQLNKIEIPFLESHPNLPGVKELTGVRTQRTMNTYIVYYGRWLLIHCSGSLEPESSCHDRDWIMELPMEADILTFTGILTPEDASVASCFSPLISRSA